MLFKSKDKKMLDEINEDLRKLFEEAKAECEEKRMKREEEEAKMTTEDKIAKKECNAVIDQASSMLDLLHDIDFPKKAKYYDVAKQMFQEHLEITTKAVSKIREMMNEEKDV